MQIYKSAYKTLFKVNSLELQISPRTHTMQLARAIYVLAHNTQSHEKCFESLGMRLAFKQKKFFHIYFLNTQSALREKKVRENEKFFQWEDDNTILWLGFNVIA